MSAVISAAMAATPLERRLAPKQKAAGDGGLFILRSIRRN
jgi:hypothetical protein